jgi:hypothetical protein
MARGSGTHKRRSARADIVVAGQARKLVANRRGGENPEQILHLGQRDMRARDGEEREFLGEGHEAQAVRERRGFDRDSDIAHTGGHGGRSDEVPFRRTVVADNLAGVDTEALKFLIDQATGLCSGLAIDEAKRPVRDIGEAGGHGLLRSCGKAFSPGGELHDLGLGHAEASHHRRRVTGGGFVEMKAGDMHEAGGREAKCFVARARPPEEPEGSLKATEGSAQQREGRITAGHD